VKQKIKAAETSGRSYSTDYGQETEGKELGARYNLQHMLLVTYFSN
jgi:hypothetical protein